MLNIAIDGPSGAGKSTIAKIIARKLNLLHLDTGAMYRSLGLKAYRLGVDANDEHGVDTFLDDTNIEVVYKDGEQRILLDGEDVSKEIRLHHISKYASDISKHKRVREKLVALQQQIAKTQPMILDGRDICLHVLKDSENKFFLTASSEVRAQRRCDELVQSGQNVNYETILNDIVQRDINDTTRENSPLRQDPSAIVVNSDNMTIEQTADYIISRLKGV